MQKSSTILDMALQYWECAWDPIFFNVGSTIEDLKNWSEQSEASKKKSPTPWGYFREPTVSVFFKNTLLLWSFFAKRIRRSSDAGEGGMGAGFTG